jgi:hypothetical protein
MVWRLVTKIWPTMTTRNLRFRQGNRRLPDLRRDPLLATLVGKEDPTGQSRLHQRDLGKPLAGKSTLNRLELTPADADASHRYKKIVAQEEEIERFFVEVFLMLQQKAPERIVLDLDAADSRSP